MDQEEALLRRGLERWRQNRLNETEEQIEEQNYIHERAAFGLKCAHETPGVLDQLLIEELWEDLNHAATELRRLDEEHDRLGAMGLAELVIAFKQDTAHEPSRERDTSPLDSAGPSNTAGAAEEDISSRVPGSGDTLAAQVGGILAAWREIMGMELDPKHVEDHLRALNRWQEDWKRRRKNGDGG